MPVHAQLNAVNDKSTRVDIYNGPRKVETIDIQHTPSNRVQAARNTLAAKGYGKGLRFIVDTLGMALIS